MKLNITKAKRSFLLFLPLIVIPFLCLVFHTLGGGRGIVKSKNISTLGLNTQLPAAPFDLQKAFQDKLKTYEQADNDSIRKAQYQRQDPYRRDPVATAHPHLTPARTLPITALADPRADQLTQQLARLRQSLHQSQASIHPNPAPPPPASIIPEPQAPDPQIDRLNAMLDKVIRIQHPQEQPAPSASAPARQPDAILPADSNANCIAAIIPEDQTLTTGTTLALRITDSILVNGHILPGGQLIYGTATLNNDRLIIHISSFREARSLYTTDWQVYDLDGLPGIHIPGMLGRDVAKQSADQGVNSLNLMTIDKSLGAQAAGAGIQAAKTFLGRKVRQLRVTVKAGYQVLLRSPHAADSPKKPSPLLPATPDSGRQPPDPDPSAAPLLHSRNQGAELLLRELGIHDSCLWFGLEWRNHSPIVYTPAYARWYIRDKRLFKRTALQEQTLEPLVTSLPSSIGNDTVQHTFTGFRPFALPKDKQLVLEIGEKGGARVLTLIIHPNQILKARSYGTTGKE